MRHLPAYLVLIGIIGTGCTTNPRPPTPSDTATPPTDIAATVEASVQAAMAELPADTPLPTPTPTATAPPTAMPSPIPLPSPSATPPPTPTPTETPKPASTSRPTFIPRPTATPRPEATPRPTATLLPTYTPIPTPYPGAPVYGPTNGAIIHDPGGGFLETIRGPRFQGGVMVEATFLTPGLDNNERSEHGCLLGGGRLPIRCRSFPSRGAELVLAVCR